MSKSTCVTRGGGVGGDAMLDAMLKSTCVRGATLAGRRRGATATQRLRRREGWQRGADRADSAAVAARGCSGWCCCRVLRARPKLADRIA